MADDLRDPMERSELLDLIRQVRGRWRTKLAIRGVALIVGLGFLVLLVSAYGLETLRFRPSAIVGFRIGLFAALAALVGWYLVRPLLRRVTDEQVALYLEEHEPSLQSAIISAIDTTASASADRGASPVLVRKLVERAVERCRDEDLGRRVEQRKLKRTSAGLGGVAVVALLLLAMGPEYLRHGVSALLQVAGNVEAASPYQIQVSPGDADVPQGADQDIAATLLGFDSGRAELLTRSAADTDFERLQLLPTDDPAVFEVKLFDLRQSLEYYVEANGVRSAVHRLNVTELPYVDRIELEYRYPAYTGLAPRTIEDGGDIAVLRGTEVQLRVIPTMRAPGGRARLEGADTPLELTPGADDVLTGSFVVEGDGAYSIELDGPNGERVKASAQYTIDVLSDLPPTISFRKPGRDTTASALEEIYVEALAEDDYGVQSLELVYSLNGGPEQTVRLFSGSRERTGELTAGHTFFLEEFELTPGDFLAYYAQVRDNNNVGGSQQAKSDLYFVQIRPFDRDFREAQSQAGGGGGGGGGGGAEVGALSQQQKRIVAATFNVVRDRDTYTADEFREHLVLLTLSQSRLRDQVEGLVSRMNSRLVEPDPSFQRIAEILPLAAEAMQEAEGALQGQNADGALPPEQRALQHLQKAEEEYELQVQMSQQGGGGGGGAGSIAEDLADLFELEMDRMANQYETAQRASQENTDQQVDELAERLRELARRQEQEAERQARRAQLQQGGGGGGGQSQRALADEVEEAARRLEQLARERQRPDLMETARRMQEAADAMRRAAASGDLSAQAEARAAAERLRDAQQQLERGQQNRADRDIQDAQRRAERLRDEQRSIAAEAERSLAGGTQTAQDRERLNRLNDRKEALEEEVFSLEQEIDRQAADIRRSERAASRELSDAAEGIRDDKIKEKIRYTRNLLRYQSSELSQFEESIEENLDTLVDRLGQAAGSLGERDREQQLADSLDRTRDLVRGLESLDRRMREGDQQARNGEGRDGEPQESQQAGQQSEGQQGQAGEGQGRGEGQGQGEGPQADAGQPGGGQGGGRQGGGADGFRDGGLGPDRGGAFSGGGARPYGWSGDLTRQFRRELGEWNGEARELRGDLRTLGLDLEDFDELLRRLGELDSDLVYKDPEELLRLQSLAIEGLKRFEFNIRRELDTGSDQLFLAATDEVPAEARALVEEYYRELSRQQDR